jgi:hypothetical protein
MHLTLFAVWLGVVLLRAVVVPPWRWVAAPGFAGAVGTLIMLVSAVTLSLRHRTFARAAGQTMTAASVAGLILIGYWRLMPV